MPENPVCFNVCYQLKLMNLSALFLTSLLVFLLTLDFLHFPIICYIASTSGVMTARDFCPVLPPVYSAEMYQGNIPDPHNFIVSFLDRTSEFCYNNVRILMSRQSNKSKADCCKPNKLQQFFCTHFHQIQ